MIEMVSLLGAVVLSIGIKLEEVASPEYRVKTFQVPLASEMLEVVAEFAERHHATPIEMIAVLGAMLVDLGANIEAGLSHGNGVN